jgi:hypothetical protein
MSLDRELQIFAELGMALWVDPERAQPLVIETLSAVSLLDLPQDHAFERAAGAMLDRAERRGMADNTLDSLALGQFGNPFFKLFPAERFILVALHAGRWSYARIARVMKLDAVGVEALAWKARTRLGIERGLVPAGPKILGPSCPEYDFERPWSQRFLDEEIPNGRERIFLQNHLMACDSCRHALNRCRDLYFGAEKLLPPPSEQQEALVRQLHAIHRKAYAFTHKGRRPGVHGWRGGLLAMAAQWDVQLLLAVGAAALAYRIFKH